MKIYGPVPSWRLGNSLGADLVEAPRGYEKTCSYNCIYCHLGRKNYARSKPEHMDIPEKDFNTLKKRIKETTPDYITFSGQGEPTLNLNLGHAAETIKKITNIPLAVLTNASLTTNRKVRDNLNKCDIVIAKIDAPEQQLFEQINNPHKGIRLEKIINSIKLLETKVCIQTLLFSCKKLTNADNKTIDSLIEIYKEINTQKPIEILLGTATRPSGDDSLRPIDQNRLQHIKEHIKTKTGIKVTCFKEQKHRQIKRNISKKQLETEIIELLKRRPCTRHEIGTRFKDTEAEQTLDNLLKKSILKQKTVDKKTYYVVS